MAAPDKKQFWNQAAGTKTFTHPLEHARFTHAVLLFAVLTCIPDDAFRRPQGTLLRHHRREWLPPLPTGFALEETVERDILTMNGNPARIAQLWRWNSA
jgi:hypothetical protein